MSVVTVAAPVGPDTIRQFVLANGIRLSVYANPTSPSVAVAGMHGAGALFETDAQCGLASLTADALNRGTKNRTFLQFSSEIDDVGASLGFDAGVEGAEVHGRALAEDLDVLLRLAADGLRNPVFPDTEVLRLRDQVLAGIAQVEDNPHALAGRRFHELLYGVSNPYGRPDEGYATTVASIAPEALRAFHARHYQPSTLALAIVGDVQPDRVHDLVQQHFGDWKPTPDGLNPSLVAEAHRRFDRGVRSSDGIAREDLVIAGKTQTELLLGWLGIRRTDPTYYASMMANFILGQLGLGGRIGEQVRDKQGMAYHASSHASSGHARQPWTVTSGVNPSNVGRAVETIRGVLKEFCDAPPTDEELRLTKQAMVGSLPLRLERNDGICGMLLTIEDYDLGLDYLQRFPAIVNGITAESVRQAASAVIDTEAYTLVTAGPKFE